MPEISRFLGIIITMYWDEARHHLAHFHARYAEYKASISIDELKIIEGTLPARVLGLVIEWATGHRKELMENWDLLRERKSPRKIDPLV